MKEQYATWGAPVVRVYLVATYEDQAAVIIGPPQANSYVKVNGNWITVSSNILQVAQGLLGESFLAPVRKIPLVTVYHEEKWKVWTVSGLRNWDVLARDSVANDQLELLKIEVWSKDNNMLDCLMSMGYSDWHTNPTTIRQSLSVRSNDYQIADKIFKELTGIDLVFGDASITNLKSGTGKISVIIPSYNANSTVAGVVTSVLEATKVLPRGVSCEIIVVDDKSHEPIKTEPFNEAVRLVRSEVRLHCAAARNLGLSIANGNIVVFLDADSYLAPNYLVNHWLRHQIFPNLILVSMREYVDAGGALPPAIPDVHKDTRWKATYGPTWTGLREVKEEVTVMPLLETDYFRKFGNGRLLGPIDLPFMVKGNNVSLAKDSSLGVRFPNRFTGWGPEDVCFAAKLIARGNFVVPVMSTGVFHIKHSPRSGSYLQQQQELVENLHLYGQYLDSSPLEDWDALSDYK